MPNEYCRPISFFRLVAFLVVFYFPLFICDQVCPVLSGQPDSLTLKEVRAEMIRIAESSRLPGADTQHLAKKFVDYYNSVASQYPNEIKDLVEMTGEIAVAYQLGYRIKNNVMLSAYFSEKPHGHIRLDPEAPGKYDSGVIFKVVERMPRFPGCEDISGSEEAKHACSKEKLLDFIGSNLRYPEEAKSQGLEGTVVVHFMVGVEGSISQINVVRGLGHGCDEEAVRLVELMNHMDQKWVPGTQRGKPVEVQFALSVPFEM